MLTLALPSFALLPLFLQVHCMVTIILLLQFSMFICVCVHRPQLECEVRGQFTAVRSPLPPCASRQLNSVAGLGSEHPYPLHHPAGLLLLLCSILEYKKWAIISVTFLIAGTFCDPMEATRGGEDLFGLTIQKVQPTMAGEVCWLRLQEPVARLAHISEGQETVFQAATESSCLQDSFLVTALC